LFKFRCIFLDLEVLLNQVQIESQAIKYQ